MKSLKETKNLVIMGMMLALTIIFDITPLGAIPLGAVSATITHLPTIVVGIIIGPVAGLIMGTLFGIISLIHALTRPITPLDPLFVNPLLSVLPRMFIGVVSHYVFSFFMNTIKKSYISSFIAGILGSLTNTVLVLGMLVLLYGQKVGEVVGANAMKWAATIAASNGLIEAIVAGFFTALVTAIFFKMNNRRER